MSRLTAKSVIAFVCLVLLGMPSAAHAQPSSDVPASLKEWVPFVTARHPDWNCARIPHTEQKEITESKPARLCVWLGMSRFVIAEQRTEFVLQGELLNDGTVPLPSNSAVRPNNLKIIRDGIAIENYIVKEFDHKISLSLFKGNYTISGELLYEGLPDTIPVPAEYGIVDIQLNIPGKTEAYRDHDSIRISQESQEQVEADSAEGRIWRAVNDASPLTIKTRIELQVSGKPRTIMLGKVLPLGSVLIRSTSSSAIAFTEGGELSIQVYQGDHNIELESILPQPVSQIALASTSEEVLPEEEIWTWNGYADLRTVEVENVRTLNVNQVQLPSGWNAASVFAVDRGATVMLKELRRGQEIAQRNELTLTRSIWPILEGKGLTVEDTFSGTMNSGFRLNALGDLKLGTAMVAGVPVPITVDAKSKAAGVELRSQSVSLRAISQIDSDRIFGATVSSGGWDTTLESIRLNINIPPSWKLLHVSNVTLQFGSWTSFWNIFDIFILLILSVFSVKIFGKRIGVLFTLLVILGKSEFMLPATFYGWTLFFAACSLLLSEKSYSLLRAGCGAGLACSLAGFVMQSLIFSKLQLIQAIHPQLQAGTRFRTITQELFGIFADSPFIWPVTLYGFMAIVWGLVWAFRGKFIIQKFLRLIVVGIGFFVVSSLLAAMANIFYVQRVDYAAKSFGGDTATYSAPAGVPMERMDELSAVEPQSEEQGYLDSVPRKAKVLRRSVPAAPSSDRQLNSGPSLPTWRWRWAQATIAGPINPDHQVTFYFIPDSLERIFCLMRLFLTLFLAYSLLLAMAKSFASTLKAIVPAPKVVTAVLAIFLIFSQQKAHAEYPDESLLNELEQRLAEEQCTEASCASIDAIALELSNDTFAMELRVRSRGVSAVTIPGPFNVLIPGRVVIDGKESVGSRLVDNYLQIKVPTGSHTLLVQGTVEPVSSLAVTFPEKPLRFTLRPGSWKVEPALGQGAIPDEVRLVREGAVDKSADSPDANKKGIVPTRDVFRVNRLMTIDERVNVVGRVTRLGDLSRATSARVPLFAGENTSSSNWTVENGAMIVTFAAGQANADFTSSLANPDQVVLKAASDSTFFDEWRVRCKDYVQCEFDGIKPTLTVVDGENLNYFIPFQGESVTVRSKLLESVKGEQVTIDSVEHATSWGETTLKGKLDLAVRATRQVTVTLSFSDAALAIDTALIDSSADSRKFSPDNVALLIEPGTHKIQVQYSKPFVPATKEKVPEVKINYRAGNITTVVNPSPARWIIWLGGSSWGPAVVFWSKLLVIIIIVVGLKVGLGLSLTWFAAIVISVAVSFLPTIWQPIPLLWIVYLTSARSREFAGTYLSKGMIRLVVSTLAVISVALLYLVVRVGLLSEPPSLITGNNSTLYSLRWFVDFAAGDNGASLPTPWVLSLPLNYWRTITLLLSVAVVFLGLKWVRETVAHLKDDESV